MYGLKYVFPAEIGAVDRGIPTSHSAPPLSEEIVSGTDVFVWPYAKGKKRGMIVSPLYRSIPEVVLKYPKFYELMTLVDALRIGKAREVVLARELLEARLLNNGQ